MATPGADPRYPVAVSMSALAAVIPMDVPVGWSDPKDVNLVHALLYLGGVPLLLFVLIAALVYLPSLLRGERLTPGTAPVENQWLGGPSTGTAQLKGPDTSESQAGGASGRW